MRLFMTEQLVTAIMDGLEHDVKKEDVLHPLFFMSRMFVVIVYQVTAHFFALFNFDDGGNCCLNTGKYSIFAED